MRKRKKRKNLTSGSRRAWRMAAKFFRYSIFAIAGAAMMAATASFLMIGIYRYVPPPGTLLMIERGLSGEKVSKNWAPIEEISPHLTLAVIAAEDTRFCTHAGFDFDAIHEALRQKENDGRLRGASTISQQTAKNAFLWPARSWVRKGAEAWMTFWMEKFWPKQRIIEVYLNVAEWGDGIFGAEAAAQRRFGKSASELTEREAVLLAAVLPNPHKWRVDPPGPYVARRAELLRQRMRQVSRDGLAACVAQSLKVAGNQQPDILRAAR